MTGVGPCSALVKSRAVAAGTTQAADVTRTTCSTWTSPLTWDGTLLGSALQVSFCALMGSSFSHSEPHP